MSDPMHLKLKSLVLSCKKEQIEIPLAHHILFYHGRMGSGKSTLVRLIDYCLGSKRAPSNRAVDEELNSVSLSLEMGKNEVTIERDIPSSKLRVSWIGPEETASVVAPLRGDDKKPIWKDSTCFSDLAFYLFGSKGLFLPLGTTRKDSPIMRLSFRDVLKFCYLPQDEMLSSFFRLDDRLLMNKSRNIMRLLVGRLTEEVANLESQLNLLMERRKEKERDSKRLREFLREFGFESEELLTERLDELEKEKESLLENLKNAREEAKSKPHPVDRIRSELMNLNEELKTAESVKRDLENTLDKRHKLRNQMIALRVRGARSSAASEILSGAMMEICPVCGLKVRAKSDVKEMQCQLCGQDTSDSLVESPDLLQHEFGSRIDELSELIERLKSSYEEQVKKVDSLEKQKEILEIRLNERETEYDPKVIAFIRELERELGGVSERDIALRRALDMNQRVKGIEAESDSLSTKIREAERLLEEERTREAKSREYISQIEHLYLKSLLEVGIPGMSETDTVKLDTKSWMPKILPGGDESKSWSYGPDESAGKNTLLKTCYALTLHRVASMNSLPLPSVLIIDAPMDHVGHGVNKEIFDQFYRHLYTVAEEDLEETQFIIIADEFVDPKSDTIDILDRYMTPDEDDNPPLITYWRETERKTE
ncbi:MAG: hypothetical protein ACFFER_08230 [Candidatus Thorarchaeota archaeon]